MKKIIGAVSSLGTVAISFLIVWVMTVATWILYAILNSNADISVTEGTVITAVLALPIALTPYVDKLFPRKETYVDRDTTQ